MTTQVIKRKTDREHYERTEMMIVRLSAPWTFVFHASELFCLSRESILPGPAQFIREKSARVFTRLRPAQILFSVNARG